MRLVAPPGVFRPRSDSWLLARCLREELSEGDEVVDVCTGSGLLAVTAGVHGASTVLAIDCSWRALLAARLNALLNGVRISTARGDLLMPLRGRRVDVIVSNPPYVPAASDEIPTGGPERAWDAGRDGRKLLDPLCEAAPDHLRPGGTLLLVQSTTCGEQATRRMLERRGMDVDVMVRRAGPLGPLMRERTGMLESRGLIEPGQRSEELLVIRARV